MMFYELPKAVFGYQLFLDAIESVQMNLLLRQSVTHFWQAVISCHN